MRRLDADDVNKLIGDVQLLEHSILGYASAIELYGPFTNYMDAIAPILAHAEAMRGRLEAFKDTTD